MLYDVSDLKKEIRVAMDENVDNASESIMNDNGTLSLDVLIESKIEDSARMVVEEAPLSLLGAGVPFSRSVSWFGDKGKSGGFILLPDDFLRLVAFQMSDWERAVHQAIDVLHPLYRLQSSRYGGLRGNPERPVAAIVNKGIGLALEFYSCIGGEGVTIKQATYIPEPKIQAGKIGMSHKIKRAVVCCTAALTAETLGDKDLAGILNKTWKDLLSYTQNGVS